MKQLRCWAAGAMAAICIFGLGLTLGGWSSGAMPVHAAGDDLEFQLHNVDAKDSLLIYSPGRRTIFVYQGAIDGNSNLQCNFEFVLGAAGGPIQRKNCEVHSLLP